MKLAAELGAPFWLAGWRVFWGSALAATDSVEEGIAQIRQGLDGYRATGAGVFQPFAEAQLAEFLGKAGQPEEGLAVLDEALANLEETEERCWEADLHRLRGELLLIQGAEEDEAAARFEQAIAVAVRQQAKLLELRATVSLARLMQAQGRTAEARKRLEAIAGWFSEGFATADFQQAQALLKDLA